MTVWTSDCLGGLNWTFSDQGARVRLNWQLNGLNLIGSGQLRARRDFWCNQLRD